MTIHRPLIAVAAVLVALNTASGQTAPAGVDISLPRPSGPFPAGRVTIHLTDEARVEPLAGDGHHREVMVDLWYPAEPDTGPPAKYLDLEGIENALGADGIRGLLGNAYDDIKRGDARTNAMEGARFTPSLKRCPLVFFSHGMGAVSQIYTAQLVDLASHDYVVAALTHTYDAALTEFPDGRRVKFDMSARPPAGSSEEDSIAYERGRLDWWAGDIRFVLNELERLDGIADAKPPVAGHIDFGRVGAFGHSAGGEAAARACQQDARLKACLDQDGEERFAPFHRDANGWGMDQAFLFMERSPVTSPPTEKDLEQMHMTRPQVEELVASLKAEQDASLRNTGQGSYRVRLKRDVTTHMSFSDLPLLESRNRTDAETATRVLQVVRDYTRAFFDRYLKGEKAPLLDDGRVGEFVDSIKRFAPAKRPGASR